MYNTLCNTHSSEYEYPPLELDNVTVIEDNAIFSDATGYINNILIILIIE